MVVINNKDDDMEAFIEFIYSLIKLLSPFLAINSRY